MDLTELQIQLRTIENQMAALQDEIEKMKPQEEDFKQEMYDKINFLAKRFPFKERLTFSKSKELKKDYIACLSYIALMNENKIYENLLYLCRLAHCIGLNATCEEIIKLGMEINKQSFYKLCLELDDLKQPLLVDCFIIANLEGEATSKMLLTIADLASILEVDKEKLRVLAIVAKSVLIDKPNILLEIPAQKTNWWGEKLGEYIPNDWITKQRCYCGTVSVSKRRYEGRKLKEERFVEEYATSEITRVESGTVVKANDIICTYISKEEPSIYRFGRSKKVLDTLAMVISQLDNMGNTAVKDKGRTNLKALCNGKVYFIEYQKTGKVKGYEYNYKETLMDIYVVSYFDNRTEFINWYNKVVLPNRIENK